MTSAPDKTTRPNEERAEPTPPRADLSDAVRRHYDLCSPLYAKFWGRHLHHGFYLTGRESKEEAAENLIEFLAERGGIRRGSRVLDVGCGLGGSSVWLAERHDCAVTGVNISPEQIRMAEAASVHLKNRPTFLLDDANRLSVGGDFDVVWAVEVLSHLSDRGEFFRRMSRLLVPGGRFCGAVWLKEENLNVADEERYVRPIEEGMLVSLPTRTEYERHVEANGLRLVCYEDISPQVAKTWDICLRIIREQSIWQFAARHGRELIAFLKSFRAMRAGFRTGAFRYAVLVAEKP